MTDTDDITIGMPVVLRKKVAYNKLLGCTVNVIPSRSKINNTNDFIAFIRQDKIDYYTDLDNANYSFEDLWTDLGIERSLSQFPLFNMAFIFHYTLGSDNFSLPNVQIKDLPYPYNVARFDISLHIVFSNSNEPLFYFDYNTDLFEEETIQKLAKSFQAFIDSIIKNKTLALQYHTVIPKEDILKLRRWNKTSFHIQPDQTVTHVFEKQVQKNPNQVALWEENKSMTYRELDQASSLLSEEISRLYLNNKSNYGGFYLERSINTLVAIIGILKANLAFIPLDVNYPNLRLKHMINDSHLKLIITQRSLLARCQAIIEDQDDISIVVIDEEFISQKQRVASDKSTKKPIIINEIAYVIYTSGSTGKPKGVPITHQALLNRIAWMHRYYGFKENHRILHKTPIGFDVSLWELFLPLFIGGQLIIAKSNAHYDPNQIIDLIKNNEISIIHFVPSMLFLFLQNSRSEECISLQHVFVSGETLTPHIIELFNKQLTCRLHNLYGPTEAAIDVTSWDCQSFTEHSAVYIGKPIANTEIYITNKLLNQMPIGFVGEILIAGIGVSPGYLNNKELTNSRFIANPFESQFKTLYRTGDLARWNKKGEIEFLGRKDNLIKIQGLRIEPREIERAILAYDSVSNCYITSIKQDNKDFIAAFITSNKPNELAINKLRLHLEQYLPSYMIPTYIKLVPSIPLSPNGKVDIAELTQVIPDQKNVLNFVVPPNQIEKRLILAWQAILGIDEIDVNSDFFNLGGDSLTAVRLSGLLYEHGYMVDPVSIMKLRTIKMIGSYVNKNDLVNINDKDKSFDLISEEERKDLPTNSVDAYPLTVLQKGMLLYSKIQPTAYHDVFRYQFESEFHKEHFQKTLNELIQVHEILRTYFYLTKNNHIIQIVKNDSEINLYIEDLSHLSLDKQTKTLTKWMLKERKLPFSFSDCPHLRLAIHITSIKTFHLTLSFHHAILDGWSVAFLIKELAKNYKSIINNQPISCTSIRLKFKDYIILESKILNEAHYNQYWLARLADCSTTNLPAYTNKLTSKIKKTFIDISSKQFSKLKNFCISCEVPFEISFLSIYMYVVSLLTKQKDIIIGQVVNCRLNDKNAHRALGLFLNTIPLRVFIKHESSWKFFMNEVLQLKLNDYSYRFFPYQHIQENSGLPHLTDFLFDYTNFNVEGDLKEQRIKVFLSDFQEETNFLINLHFDYTNNDPKLFINYHSDKIDSKIISFIKSTFLNCVQTIINSQEAKLLDCSSVESEQKLVLKFAHGPKRTFSYSNFVEAFTAAVKQYPTHLAVSDETVQLTYNQLNFYVNGLCHVFANFNLKKGDIVAVALPRSHQFLIAMIAIFKSGLIYLPLALDKQDLDKIIKQVDIKLMIGGSKMHNTSAIPYLNYFEISFNSDKEFVKTLIHEEDPAYIIFTSGSTGEPKGVLVHHAGFMNHLAIKISDLGISQKDILIQNASQTFDVSIWQFLAALLVGGKVAIIPEHSVQQPKETLKFLVKSKATIYEAIPSLLKYLLEAFKENPILTSLLQLRLLLVTGEACPTSLIHTWFNVMGKIQVVNAYGPSECSDDVTHFKIAQQDDLSADYYLPLGRPLANLNCYVLDTHFTISFCESTRRALRFRRWS